MTTGTDSREETVCGYTNYETFTVAVHIDNTESDYLRVQAWMRRLFKNHESKEEVVPRMKTWLRANYSYLVKTGKRKINWEEIATDEVDCYLENLKYEEANK